MKKNTTILLIEDDELDIISVQRSLKKFDLGYELYTAFNGKDALSFLKTTEPDLLPDIILLDLNMPKMNGIEFLKALRQDEALKSIKVFIMTSSIEGNDRSVTEGLGISGYIIKPYYYNEDSNRADSMDAFVQFHLRSILSDNNI